jgi:hypothetical protein
MLCHLFQYNFVYVCADHAQSRIEGNPVIMSSYYVVQVSGVLAEVPH